MAEGILQISHHFACSLLRIIRETFFGDIFLSKNTFFSECFQEKKVNGISLKLKVMKGEKIISN